MYSKINHDNCIFRNNTINQRFMYIFVVFSHIILITCCLYKRTRVNKNFI